MIIPSNNPHSELIKITIQASNQSVTPNEIIIIDSSPERGKCPDAIRIKSDELGIKLSYHSAEKSYPGHARNLGIAKSRNDYLAFLDVKTSPHPDWLKQVTSLESNAALHGVWGLTNFKVTNRFEKLMKDGFFGRAPRRTLPGSIVRRSTLDHVGLFIDWARAGEDTDWIQRVELHGLQFISPLSSTITYTGLQGQEPAELAKKWWRNYNASAELPHLFPQKILIWTIFYPTLVLLAFNWNSLIADWKTDSILYIPNITKIVAITPALLYFMVRGLLIPYHNKVPYSELMPLRWISIATVCLIGDVVKAIAMLRPTLKRRNLTVHQTSPIEDVTCHQRSTREVPHTGRYQHKDSKSISQDHKRR